MQVTMATFWLLDLAGVAMTATLGYFVLFAVRLVFRRRWPGTTTSGSSGMLNAVYVAFCASLVALVTLVAILRAQADSRVPQWMTYGYAAVIWATLGLLMLKYGGQAVQILWRYRRQNRWSTSEEDTLPKSCCGGLPVLSISCLKSLAVCSTLLAELSLLRGISCVLVASQSTEEVAVDSWRGVVLHYFCWEAACVVVVLRMLHQTPIAVYACNDGTKEARRASPPRRETPSAPASDDGEIQIQFQVPSVRELIAAYVVPSNASLLSVQRRGMALGDSVEHRYCQVHRGQSPSVGAEYVNCRCEDDQVLSSASVPLLAEEYEPERSTQAIEKETLTFL
jgi:hypothetical protein